MLSKAEIVPITVSTKKALVMVEKISILMSESSKDTHIAAIVCLSGRARGTITAAFSSAIGDGGGGISVNGSGEHGCRQGLYPDWRRLKVMPAIAAHRMNL
ncbi:hypothetical protein ACP5PY_06225 [Photobacterium leiognathi subsp. mandapamensis]